MPYRRWTGDWILSALALLAVVAGPVLPLLVQAATAGCPTPPPIAAATYTAAVTELSQKGSKLTPRQRLVPSARPTGTILEAPKSELLDGICYATFAVSDGSLAKAAMLSPAAKLKINPDIVNKQAPAPTPETPGGSQSKLPSAKQCPPLPSFSPRTLGAAQIALRERHIEFRAQSRPSSLPRGDLIGNPQMGSDCTVTLVVSDGSLTIPPKPPPPPVPPEPKGCPPLPSFSPRTLSAAQNALRERHIEFRTQSRPSSLPRGDLIGNPQMGSDCTVTLVVSDGTLTTPPKPPPPPVPPEPKGCPPLPKLAAPTLTAAVAALREQFLLRPEYRPSSLPRGSLIESPKAALENGRCIATLLVSDGTLAPKPPPKSCTQPPDVATHAIGAALKVLSERGFRAIRRDQPSSLAQGTVISQSPPALQNDVCFVTLTVSDGTLVRVPPLKDLLRDQAQDSTLKLKLLFQAAEAQSDKPPGTVIEQTPQAGAEVPRGFVVRVTVARPRDLAVPNVIGLPAVAAQQKLSQFTVESVPEESVRPSGEVTNQDPHSPATRKRGDSVRIFVSDGSLVEVPDVMQITVAEARRRIDAVGAGLSVTTSNRDDGAAPDTVIAQSPPAKAVVKRGSGVALEISLGLPVPSVVGLQLEEARTQLARFDPSAEYVADAAPRDQVLAQDPGPLTRVAGGAPVRLRVSDFSLVAVPDVRTMTLEAARSALGAAGLEVQLGEGPDRDSATVAQQTPQSAVVVPRGTAIRLDLKGFLPVWLVIAAAATGLLGAGVAAYKYWTKLLKVDARIKFGPAPPQAGGDLRAGPDIAIEARLETGETTIHLTDGGTG